MLVKLVKISKFPKRIILKYFSLKYQGPNTISSYKTILSENLINYNDQNTIHFFFLFIKGGICIFEKRLNYNILNNEKEYNTFKLLTTCL